MTVYSLNLNKGDYAYSIAYHQGNDDMQLDTNEEALNSMKLSIQTLIEAIRKYAVIDDCFNITLNKVKFGNDGKDHSVQFTISTFAKEIYPRKFINQAMNIRQAGSKEQDINQDRVEMLLNIEALRSEVIRYLNGERAQSELDFNDELDQDAAAESDVEDIQLATVEDDPTPPPEDIDLFDME